MNASPERATRPILIVACCALAFFANPARGAIIDYTYTFTSDVESWNEFEDPQNIVINLDLTSIGILPAFKVTAVAWDVDLVATAPSWLSEMAVNFNRVNFLAPGYQVQSPGGPTNFFGDFFIFSSIGLADVVITDGILKLEFWEISDDYPDGVDGLWLAGSTLTFRLDATPLVAAPEPSTIGMTLSGLVVIGGCGAWRRARRASAA